MRDNNIIDENGVKLWNITINGTMHHLSSRAVHMSSFIDILPVFYFSSYIITFPFPETELEC